MDTTSGEKLSSIYVANIDIIDWSVRSSCKRGREGEFGGEVLF